MSYISSNKPSLARLGVLVTVLSPAPISMFAFRGAKARWHPRRSNSSRFSEDDCTKCPKMAERRMMM